MRISKLSSMMAVILAVAGTRAHAQVQQSGSRSAARMAHADSLMSTQAWEQAADAYRGLTRDEPSNGEAWFGVGSALEQLKRNGDAAQAYARAADLGFQPAAAHYRAARNAAQTGSSADALAHLRKAAAIGLPLPVLDTTSAFVQLRSMAEFGEIRRAAEAVRYPCRAQHDFDFWIGTFDATPWNQPNARPTGQLHNTAEYEGCVIVERWMGVANNGGMSMSFYDVNRHVWRMVWNDDSNSSNDFEGSVRDGAMRFEGWVLDAKGNKMLASNVLQEVSPGVIRHIYSTSSDGGKTWNVRSDGRFVRRK